MEEIVKDLLSRGVEEVIERDHLLKRLENGDKLRIKYGIDPTSPNIHIGRAVVLLKLRDFQRLGHKIIFIIGDFTAVIGDTSDKKSERPLLSRDIVQGNLKTYLKQAGKLLELEKAEIYFNSKWLKKLTFEEVGRIADVFSVADFISRKNIKSRLREGRRVSLRETLYPLMQGYDSVRVKADLEVGGTDQKFNMLAGRTLQQFYRQPPQDIMTMGLILGTDGRKMSSSWDNTININDSAQDIYGKVMSIPDEMMESYFVHCTRIPLRQVSEISKRLKEKTVNPRDIKMQLAREITAIYHGKEESRKAEENFRRVFQKNRKPAEIEGAKVSSRDILSVLTQSGLAKSRSEARRLILQKGVKLNGKLVSDEKLLVSQGDVISKGKREFRRIV